MAVACLKGFTDRRMSGNVGNVGDKKQRWESIGKGLPVVDRREPEIPGRERQMNRTPAYDNNRPRSFRNTPYDLRSSVAEKAMPSAQEVSCTSSESSRKSP